MYITVYYTPLLFLTTEDLCICVCACFFAFPLLPFISKSWICQNLVYYGYDKKHYHFVSNTSFTFPFFVGDWENNCNELQKMLIVRSLRQDRVSICVTSFIVNNLGSCFVEPPVLNMKSVSVSFYPFNFCCFFCFAYYFILETLNESSVSYVSFL